MDLSISNFDCICRACLLIGDLKPFDELSISNTFKYITNIDVFIQDELPRNICNRCIEQLTNIQLFIELCKTNDLKLRSLIKIPDDIKHEPYCNENSLSFSEDCDKINITSTDLSILKNETPAAKDSSADQEEITVQTNFCHICNKKFCSKTSLARHYRNNVLCRPKSYKLLKCELCHKEFTTAQRRKEHMNIHTGVRPYVCEFCGENFKIYSTYFKHTYRHKVSLGEIKDKKYKEKRVKLKLKCDICNDKVFASRSGYSNHLLTKHGMGPGNQGESGRLQKDGVRKYLCNYCAKTFYTKPLLEGHLRIHTDEKPFACKECGKRFKQKASLRVHQLNHLQNRPRPFQCDVCSKTFTQKDHCEVHKRTHTGEKPYSCNFCGKSFNYRTYWKIHLRMHTGEMPFSCSVCHVKYHDKCSLRKHEKKKHQVL